MAVCEPKFDKKTLRNLHKEDKKKLKDSRIKKGVDKQIHISTLPSVIVCIPEKPLVTFTRSYEEEQKERDDKIQKECNMILKKVSKEYDKIISDSLIGIESMVEPVKSIDTKIGCEEYEEIICECGIERILSEEAERVYSIFDKMDKKFDECTQRIKESHQNPYLKRYYQEEKLKTFIKKQKEEKELKSEHNIHFKKNCSAVTLPILRINTPKLSKPPKSPVTVKFFP